MAVSKIIPSGLTDGQALKITQTATAGNTFHTADASAKDHIFMWAINRDTVNRTLTIELGGATAPDQNVPVVVEPNVPTPVLIGAVLTNSKTVKAFADAANVISVWGEVNRYSG